MDRFTTVQELEMLKVVTFGNALSLAEVETDWWLLESLIDKWDPSSRVFRFSIFEMFPTLEKYAALLGVPFVGSFSTYLFRFKLRVFQLFGTKKQILKDNKDKNSTNSPWINCVTFSLQRMPWIARALFSWILGAQRRLKALELSVWGICCFQRLVRWPFKVSWSTRTRAFFHTHLVSWYILSIKHG